ncbi:hypothetical protein DEJ04_02845 [Curtobacterium sp. MCLR17_044]|nr:hypothetical protein DEJ04_02845 [Curtobacterium sp. MCLR17_044]
MVHLPSAFTLTVLEPIVTVWFGVAVPEMTADFPMLFVLVRLATSGWLTDAMISSYVASWNPPPL